MASVWGELKRRNVIRVAVVYLVSAWLLLQLTDVLSSLLAVPDWTGSLVVLLLVLGFVPVMIFVWIYELTPDGLKREKDVDRTQSVTAATGKRINTLIIVLLVLAIASVVADRLVPEIAPETESQTQVAQSADNEVVTGDGATVDENSIAVLPFTDLSPEQDQRYFTDGISEELLNVLAHVEGLRVASRTTSFAYRNTNLTGMQLGQELNVRYLLEGSMRKDGDRIRITAQFIEAATDRHLWSENFDRDLEDIFAIQDEIASAIVDALVNELGFAESARAVSVVPATKNLDAYELYLRAMDMFERREKLPGSVALFEQAIELDPEFARAWEGVAAVEAILNYWVFDDGIEHLPLAKAAATRAVELDPSLSMPYAVLGFVATHWDGELIRAMEYFDHAIQNDPKNTNAWLWRAISWTDLGFFDEALSDLAVCQDIDPAYLICKQQAAAAHLIKGHEEKALQLFEETLREGFHWNDNIFISAYVRRDQTLIALLLADMRTGNTRVPIMYWVRAIQQPDADHRAGLARFEAWSEESGMALDQFASILMAFRSYDRLIETPSNAESIMWNPDAANFRQSAQFEKLVRKSGILDYWQVRGFPPHCRPVGDDGFECD